MPQKYTLDEIAAAIQRMRARVDSGQCVPHMAAARLSLEMAEQLLRIALHGNAARVELARLRLGQQE